MMKKYAASMLIMAFLLVHFSTFAQSQKSYWTKTSLSQVTSSKQLDRKAIPLKEEYYLLDLNALKNQLANVGNREIRISTIINLPNSEGELKQYRVFEASIMEENFQAQHPEIRSYAGQGVENPTETIRFSITPKGFHAMVLGSDLGTQFIDPFTQDAEVYSVYSKRDIGTRDFEWECGVIDDPLMDRSSDFESSARNANDGTLRNYRIAIACTGEYGSFHGTTVPQVMAAMAVTMTRVNGIYERDLSITMTMVDNTSIIFFDGATDPFNNNNAGVLINQSQSVINANIGAANYDIGHTFSTGGGGLAGLGVTCNNGNKARGITGLPQPVGDVFDVDFVAHELGHQFGAPHTFNGNASGTSCQTQRSSSDAYEPGSGSTIMAYAGICPPQNVQNNSDAYFHQISLVRIFNHVLSTGACPINRSSTGNIEPTANAGANFTIPQGTPYKLIGSSTDPDGVGTHTYTWEQFDLGPTGEPTETTVSGPIVRSFEGTSDPIRYVPRLEDLRSSAGSSAWEKLSIVNRPINYRLTVRDNDARGGQTDFDQMTATVTTNAGPFLVTSQNTSGITWAEGSTQTVTWDVAGTTGNGINENNVNILLAEDGVNYNTVLASNTPNDGSHDIVVPTGISSVTCRIMVEATNGIFFNINSEDFAIGATLTCNSYEANNVNSLIPDGLGTTSPQNGPPLFETINVTDDINIESMSLSINVNHTFVGDLLIRLNHPNGSTEANVWIGNCGSNNNINVTFEDGAPNIACGNPTQGTFAAAEPLSVFTGLSSLGDWELLIADFFQGETGTLVSWSMEFCTTSGLSVEDNTFDGLKIHPNPNNGIFKVGFNSNSGKEISIEVFDIGGRTIYAKRFEAISRFEEVINLGNVQSGVYLLNILDGTQKIIKKIILE